MRYTVTENGCWEWVGPRNIGGYGSVPRTRHGTGVAHRVAWEREHGPIPDGMLVCHSCDNPPCVNPSHLFLGTHRDNTNDKIAKGRQARGETHRAAVLRNAQVLEIRFRAAWGQPNWAIAAWVGVSEANTSRVVRRKIWRHL